MAQEDKVAVSYMYRGEMRGMDVRHALIVSPDQVAFIGNFSQLDILELAYSAASMLVLVAMGHGMDANRARIDLARSFGLGMKDGALEGSRKLSWRKDYGALDRISDLAEELGIDMPGDDDER